MGTRPASLEFGCSTLVLAWHSRRVVTAQGHAFTFQVLVLAQKNTKRVWSFPGQASGKLLHFHSAAKMKDDRLLTYARFLWC